MQSGANKAVILRTAVEAALVPLYRTGQMTRGAKAILDLHGNIKTAGGPLSWNLLRGISVCVHTHLLSCV